MPMAGRSSGPRNERLCPFIKRPIATSLIIVAIFLAGLAAYPFLPVAPLPSVEFPTLTVTANYPGG